MPLFRHRLLCSIKQGSRKLHPRVGKLDVAPDTHQGYKMKRVCLAIAVLLSVCTAISAQDTIIFMNGDEVITRVREVSDTELKYSLWDNQDGPVYVKRAAEVFMVKYHNGRKEVISNNTSQKQSVISRVDYGKMEYNRGDLIIDGHKLTDNDVLEIFGDLATESYLSACSQRRRGNLLIALGWVEFGGGIALLAISKAFDYSIDFLAAYYTGLSALSLGLVEVPVGYILKGISNGRLSNMADKYNNTHGYCDNFSIKITPTIVYASTETSTLNCGFGAGLSIKF